MIAICTLRRASCVLTAYFLCIVSLGQASRAEHHHGQGRPVSGSGSDSGRFFFGTSHDAKLGTLAWLLYLDNVHQGGQIFVAPRMVRFSKFELREDGALTFQSLDLVGKNYRFSGTLKSEKIVGEIQLVDGKSGNPIDKWQMNAAQLPAQNARASADRPVGPGGYSNVDYSKEGGDLTGVDIRFFSTSMGTTGMIVFYESYWGEPTLTPLAFSRVEIGKSVIRFETETPSGVARYHLLPTPTGGLFNRDDVTHEKGEKDITLQRNRSAVTTPASNHRR